MKSYSYYIQRPIIYYLIINESNEDKIIFSILAEERNFEKNKMVIKVEDNGEKEIFQTEVEIVKELFDYKKDHTSNRMNIVPVDKETNIAYFYSNENKNFNYENINFETNSNSSSTLIIIIVIVVLILIIIIGLLLYRKKKKEKSNNVENNIDMNEKIISDN